MSDENKPVVAEQRTLETVQRQFSECLVQAGYKRFMISKYTKELDLLLSTLQDLDVEAIKFRTAAQQVPQLETPKQEETK